MTNLESQLDRKNILVDDLHRYSDNPLEAIASCNGYLHEFPLDVEVLYTEADLTCQFGLKVEGMEDKINVLKLGAAKLELLCNDVLVGEYAKKYLSKVRLMIGECLTDAVKRIVLYDSVDDPVAKLLCAYLHAESSNDFIKSKKCIDAYSGKTKLKECFSIPDVMVKYKQVQDDFSTLAIVTWKDSADYKKNMVLFGLLLKDDGFAKLDDVNKDIFLSSLYSVYASLPIIPDKKPSKIIQQDQDILKMVLSTLYLERARKIPEDTLENIALKSKIYSTLFTIDQYHIESNLYLGDKAVDNLDWNSVFKHYFTIYNFNADNKNSQLNNTLFYDQGRMPFMLYSFFKRGLHLKEDVGPVISAEAESTSEKLICDFLLKLNYILLKNPDLHSPIQRELYFGFDALRTFTELSLRDPNNKLYVELVKDLTVLSTRKQKSAKQWWKLW